MKVILSDREFQEYQGMKANRDYWHSKHKELLERIRSCETWIQGDQIYINEQKAVAIVREIIEESYE